MAFTIWDYRTLSRPLMTVHSGSRQNSLAFLKKTSSQSRKEREALQILSLSAHQLVTRYFDMQNPSPASTYLHLVLIGGQEYCLRPRKSTTGPIRAMALKYSVLGHQTPRSMSKMYQSNPDFQDGYRLEERNHGKMSLTTATSMKPKPTATSTGIVSQRMRNPQKRLHSPLTAPSSLAPHNQSSTKIPPPRPTPVTQATPAPPQTTLHRRHPSSPSKHPSQNSTPHPPTLPSPPSAPSLKPSPPSTPPNPAFPPRSPHPTPNHGPTRTSLSPPGSSPPTIATQSPSKMTFTIRSSPAISSQDPNSNKCNSPSPLAASTALLSVIPREVVEALLARVAHRRAFGLRISLREGSGTWGVWGVCRS